MAHSQGRGTPACSRRPYLRRTRGGRAHGRGVTCQAAQRLRAGGPASGGSGERLRRLRAAWLAACSVGSRACDAACWSWGRCALHPRTTQAWCTCKGIGRRQRPWPAACEGVGTALPGSLRAPGWRSGDAMTCSTFARRHCYIPKLALLGIPQPRAAALRLGGSGSQRVRVRVFDHSLTSARPRSHPRPWPSRGPQSLPQPHNSIFVLPSVPLPCPSSYARPPARNRWRSGHPE